MILFYTSFYILQHFTSSILSLHGHRGNSIVVQHWTYNIVVSKGLSRCQTFNCVPASVAASATSDHRQPQACVAHDSRGRRDGLTYFLHPSNSVSYV